ncbi:MAG: peptidylprolyl isomerase, partial [Clostridia bacterium]|nr:peptidylprolyl isomerase [Clostridia bacterium]
QFFINQSSATVFGVRGEYAPEKVRAKYDQAYDNYVTMYKDAGMDFTSYYATKDDFFAAQHQETYVYDWIPSEVWDLYEQVGGNISLDGAWRRSGGHTVFGQVFDGMDVVEAIAAVPTDESNNKPLTDVVIESIEVTTYGATQGGSGTAPESDAGTATTEAATTDAATSEAASVAD